MHREICEIQTKLEHVKEGAAERERLGKTQQVCGLGLCACSKCFEIDVEGGRVQVTPTFSLILVNLAFLSRGANFQNCSFVCNGENRCPQSARKVWITHATPVIDAKTTKNVVCGVVRIGCSE